jgi:hypothetical protein
MYTSVRGPCHLLIEVKIPFVFVTFIWIGILYQIGHKSNIGSKISSFDLVQTFYLPVKKNKKFRCADIDITIG